MAMRNEICTRGSIQGEENSVSKNFGKFKFLRKLHVVKICTFFHFCPTLTPFYSIKKAEIEKNEYFQDKIQPSGYPNIAKSRVFSSQFFKKKIIIFCSILAIFCQKQGRSHSLKGCNQNLTYPIVVSQFLGMFLCKMFCSSTSQYCDYNDQRSFFLV